MTSEQELVDARREVGYRRNALGFASLQVNKTARQLSGITRTAPDQSSRGVKLLAELAYAKKSRQMGREALATAEARLAELLEKR